MTNGDEPEEEYIDVNTAGEILGVSPPRATRYAAGEDSHSRTRPRLAILATALLLLVGLGLSAGRIQPIALVLTLVDVELWPVPLGLRVRILEYGALLLTFTLPVWPVVAVLAGVALVAIWWPRRTRVGGQ